MHALIILIAVCNVLLASYLFIKKNCQGSPFQFFFLTINAFFLCPAVFDQPGVLVDWHPYADPLLLTNQLLFRAHSITFLVLSTFAILDFIFPPKNKIEIVEADAHFGIFRFAPGVLVVCTVLTWCLYGQQVLDANFLSSRAGAYGIFPLLTAYSALFVIPLPYLAIRRRKYLLCSLYLIVLGFPAIVFGGARQMFLVGFSLAIYALLPKKIKQGSRFLLLVCFCVPLIETVAAVIKKLRNLSSLSDRLSYLSSDFFADLLSNNLLSSSEGESGLRFVFYSFCNGLQINQSGQFLYLRRTLLAWLPSKLDFFSIKPADFESNMFDAVMSVSGGTMHPTFMGTIYADSGWFFIIWVVFIFMLMKIIEKLIGLRTKYTLYFWLIACFVSVMWARGTIYGVTVLMVPCICLILIEWYFTGQVKKSSNKNLM